MSNSVDTKVVEMQFNNQNFEKNVSTSINTLDKLKTSVNSLGSLGKPTQSFLNSFKTSTGEVQSSINNVDFTPFASALDTIQGRLSTLGVVGMTVVSNLTTSIMGKAKQLLTAIPAQISQGGLSRALNIENARFQLKGLGVAWKDIEEDINYGVKGTAYGLDAAAKAASQLTASGVQLGTEMQEALRGISGVAAMTNSTYEDISPIFTTIAGQGKVMTMQLRQLEARGLNVAAELGKRMGKTEEEIREMVTEGEMDFKTFAHYMNEAFGEHAKKANETYSGSLGNVKAALSRIGAEFKQSRLENLRQIFVSAIPAIDKFKKDLSEITTFLNFLSSMVSGKVASAIEAIDFSPVLEKASGLIRNIDLGSGINYSDVTKLLAEVKEEGVLTTEVLKKTEAMGINVTGVLAKSLGQTEDEIREAIKKGEIDYTRFASALGAAVVNVSKYGKAIDKAASRIKEVFDKIVWVVGKAATIIKNAYVDISTGLSRGFKITPLQVLSDVLNGVKTILLDVGLALSGFISYMSRSGNNEKIITFFEGVGTVLRNLYDTIKILAGYAEKAFGKIFFIHSESTVFTKAIDLICNVLQLLGKLMISTDGLLVDFAETVGNIASKIGNFLYPVFNSAANAVENLTNKLGDLKDSAKGIRQFFDPIIDILQSVAAYAGEALAGLWDNLVAPFKNNNTNFLLSFVSSLEIFMGALASSKLITVFKQLTYTLNTGFIKVLNDLRVSLEAYQRSMKAGMLEKIAKSILILAAAMLILSLIDKDKLLGVTVAVTELMYALMGAFAIFDQITKSYKITVKNSLNLFGNTSVLIGMAAAILILAGAAKMLSSLDPEAMKRGIIGLTVIMAELVGFLQIAKLDGKRGKGVAKSLVGIGLAVYILAAALQKLCEINPDTLGTGLGAMAAIFGVLGIFTNIVNPKKIISTGLAMNLIAASLLIFAKGITAIGEIPVETLKVGLLGMAGALLAVAVAMRIMPKGSIFDGAAMVIAAAALLILADALAKFGNIPMDNLKTGLIGMGVALAEIAVAMLLMKGALPGAAALLVVSAAMKILAGVVKTFAAIPVDKMVAALVAFGAALTIIVLAGMGATAAAAGLLALGAAVALIGAGFLMAGTGILAFSAGLALLATSGAAGISVLAMGIMTIINMIPAFLAQLGYGLIALVDVLANGYDSFVRFGTTLIVATCDGFIQALPKIMELIGVLFDTLETLFFDYGPRLINMGINMILMLADGIIDGMPDIVDKAFVIIITFIDSMSAALDEHGDEFWQAVDNFILSVLDFLGLKVKDWAQAAKDWLAGLKQGFEEKAEEIKENIKTFVREKIIEPLKGFWEDLKGVGAYLIDGLIQGILNTPILGTIAKLGGRIIGAFNGSLQINSPSKLTEMTGEYFIEGFVKGINKNKYKITQASNGMIKALKIDGKKFTLFEDPIRKIKLDTKNFVEQSVASINWGTKTINTYIKKFGQALFDYGYTNSPSSEYDFATDSIAKLSKTLYLNSDAYKESNENVQAYVNAIKTEEDHIKDLTKEIKKQKELADAGSDDAKSKLNELNNELESTKSNLQSLGAALSEELTNIANGAKNAFDSLRENISGTITNSLDILKVSVTDYVDLFSKFEEVQNIPVDTILKTMRSQIVGVSKWRDDLTELGKRGIADGLLDQLRNMGVQGAGYIQAFLKMTDEELSQANLMFRAKNELTSQTLIDGMKDQFKAIEKWTSNIELLAQKGINFDLLMDLQEAGPDNAEYVQALADMTADQIEEVNKLYKKSKTLPTSIADRVLSSLALSNEGKGNLVGEDMASALAEVLGSDDIGEKFTEALAVGIKNSETSVIEASKVVGESSLVEFNKYFSTENGSYIAVNMVNGLAAGLITGQSIIAEASRELADVAYDSTKDELGIHSPSKAFENIGKFSDIGLANGLLKYSSVVKDASTSIGDSAIKTMRESMDTISELLNNEVNNPVITPILDLSDISNNAGRINKMFNDPTIGTNLEELPGIQNGKVFNFTQNNYSPKALSRIEIYRQTKNQFSTLKGMV